MRLATGLLGVSPLVGVGAPAGAQMQTYLFGTRPHPWGLTRKSAPGGFFASARCPECGHDFLIAYACKGRGVCPSCNTRRMAETAAHLVDHVFPRLPVRQWALSVPKRLRYFEQHDRRAVTAALNPFLRLVAPSQHQWRLSV
jgi:hypothetical protein